MRLNQSKEIDYYCFSLYFFFNRSLKQKEIDLLPIIKYKGKKKIIKKIKKPISNILKNKITKFNKYIRKTNSKKFLEDDILKEKSSNL